MSSVKLPIGEFHVMSAGDRWNTDTKQFILEGQRIETTWTIFRTFGVNLAVATSGMITTTNSNFTDAKKSPAKER